VYTVQGFDIAPISCIASLEDMTGIPDESQDFIIACHVIEHLRNPLRAFERVYPKLRTGGRFVLIVPEQRLTFDRNRELTTIDHLILDHEEPSFERDLAHYSEYYVLALNVREDLVPEVARREAEARGDCHFHTWTHESFRETVQYVCRNISPWSDVWSHPAPDHPAANEFYFVLTK
jgi:hypothetical protein